MQIKIQSKDWIFLFYYGALKRRVNGFCCWVLQTRVVKMRKTGDDLCKKWKILACVFLKQFQLLSWRIGLLRLLSVVYFYFSKLLVRYSKNTNLTKFWKERFHTFHMNLHVFLTSTMAYVYRELGHRKAITLKIFTEVSMGLLVLFGLGR